MSDSERRHRERRQSGDPGLVAIAVSLEHVARAIHGRDDAARLKDITAELSAARRRLEAATPHVSAQGEIMTPHPISGGAGEVDVIEVEVRRMSDAVDSAAVAFVRLADLIESMKQDPVRLADLANQLRAKADKLAESVVNAPPSP